MIIDRLQPIEILIDELLQLSDIETHWPGTPVSVSNGNVELISIYRTPYFRHIYKYSISYDLIRGIPTVFILEPKIEANQLIHMYRDGSLCLFHFQDYPFNRRFLLGSEIIPWIHEWIHNYELFLVNGGIWKSPEAPH